MVGMHIIYPPFFSSSYQLCIGKRSIEMPVMRDACYRQYIGLENIHIYISLCMNGEDMPLQTKNPYSIWTYGNG